MSWFARQVNMHPHASPGLVVARLIMWSFSLIWGFHVLIEENALRHPVYAALHLQSNENIIGATALVIAAMQIWRILTHNAMFLLGFFANITALAWHMYLLSAMFVFVPLAGPIFSASMTLMCVISIVSFWNDPWLNTNICSRAT